MANTKDLSAEDTTRVIVEESGPGYNAGNPAQETDNDEETPFALMKSPFAEYVPKELKQRPPIEASEDVQPKADPHELSDLLLDVAVTTTIAGLTDGTDVVGPASALSYICFLGLAFWVWASQVLYDIRFRQKDWLHLFFALLQLLTFCALAGFAGGFDIGQGIRPDKDTGIIQQLLEPDAFQYIDQNPNAENLRSQFIARVNGIGIAAVMAFSRVVLLIQYMRAYCCSASLLSATSDFSKTGGGIDEEYYRKVSVQVRKYQEMIRWHFASLAVAMFAYITVAVLVGINGNDDDLASNITVVVLCVVAVFFEIGMHYVADWKAGLSDLNPQPRNTAPRDARSQQFPNHLPTMRQQTLFKRTDTLFIIILGTGLDKITKGFQFIAGNVSVGPQGSVGIICAAVIFVTQITLHFNLHKTTTSPNHWQILAWFIVNFFYLSAVILTLQGVASLLQLSNLVNATNLPLDVVRLFGAALGRSPTEQLLPEQFTDLRKPLENLGLSLENMVSFVNEATTRFGPDSTNSSSVYNTILVNGVVCLQVLLKRMDAEPQYGTLLYARIDNFLDVDDTSAVDLARYANDTAFTLIIEDVHKSFSESVHWYFGAAGATLLLLFILWHIIEPRWYRAGLIQSWKYPDANGHRELWIQMLRLVFGVTLILLLTIAFDDVERPEGERERPFTFYGSRIHILAERGWMLPIVAILMLTEQVLEVAYIWHLHRREKHNTGASRRQMTGNSEKAVA